VRSTDYKAPRYVVFRTTTLSRPSWDPSIFLSTLFSNALILCEHQPSGHQYNFLSANWLSHIVLKGGNVNTSVGSNHG